MRRSSTSRAGGSGFTLLELIVVICVFATLFSFAIDRMLRYQEDAERAVMRSTLASFKTALQLKVAELLIDRHGDQIVKLQGQNPVLWLEEAPSNYLGAFPAAEMREKPPGNWYFDTGPGDLVYIPRGAIFAAEESKAPYELRFRVRIDYETAPSPQGPIKRLSAAVLAPVVAGPS